MKAIVYMLRKTIKNGIIDILHHPMQLIVYLFIALTTVSGVITAMTSNISEEETHFDFRILQGAYLLILYFISVPIMLKGTNASTTFFKMSDVANVFTAPISEKKILIYGVDRWQQFYYCLYASFHMVQWQFSIFRLRYGTLFCCCLV